jgi:hypothetical protein
MLNNTEITLAHRQAYTYLDKWFRLQHKLDFWGKHPILAYNLYYGRQPVIQYPKDPNLSYKILSNKWHYVAFFHKDFPDVFYVPELITPQTSAKVHREMTSFFNKYKALEAAREQDYIMDDPKTRGKRYESKGYREDKAYYERAGY